MPERMADPQDSVEMESLPTRNASPGRAQGRPWLGVRFLCSNTYVRVFRNAAGTAYDARCPKCGRCVQFKVGRGGTDQRFFEVRC